MRKTISLALVFTVLVTGLMLVLGALSTPSSTGVAKTPYISALSDAAVGNALACKPSCTNMRPGPHPMPQQCFSTTDCTDCVWFEEEFFYIAVNCNGN